VRAALAAALLLAACKNDLAPQWRVVDLRILAVRAEVPVPSSSAAPLADVDSGDRLRLTALVANPLGRAPFRLRFATCIPEATDALPPCLDPARLRDLDALLADPRVVALPDGAPVAGRAHEWFIEVTVPDLTAVFDRLIARAYAEPGYQCRLYVELPVLVIADAGGRRELAVKRVRLVPRSLVAGTPLAGAYIPNRDPLPAGVYFATTDIPFCEAGAPVAVPCSGGCASGACDGDGFCDAPIPAVSGVLCAVPDVASVGEFNQCAPDGTRTLYGETLEWQWYATDGDFTDAGFTGNAMGSSVDFDRPRGPFTIWTIVRDGRGGEGWLTRDVPPAAN
jgi:hypothetical protein